MRSMVKIIQKKVFDEMTEAKQGKKNPLFGKKHTEETLKKMRGRKHSEETKTKIGAANIKEVEVFDKQINETTTYTSGVQATEALGCGETTIRRYIKSQKLYKGRYQVRSTG